MAFATLQYYIDQGFHTGSVTANNEFSNVAYNLRMAAVSIGDQDWVQAEVFLTQAAADLGGANNHLLSPAKITKSFIYRWEQALSYINEKWPEDAPPPTVDMDSILSAMVTASFDHLQEFIGIVDAYRVALWNAPFNADYYAALARGFQKWP